MMKKIILLLVVVFISTTTFAQDKESELSKGMSFGVSFNNYSNTEGGGALNIQSPIFAKYFAVDFSGGISIIEYTLIGETTSQIFNAYPLTLGLSGSIDYKEVIRGSFSLGASAIIPNQEISPYTYIGFYTKFKVSFFLMSDISMFIEGGILSADFSKNGSGGIRADNIPGSPRYMEGFTSAIGLNFHF